ncbi:TonB-dependent receptor [Pelagicoccus sp. SDUM812003]|uniref:TonB-dependent receptor n=1 Tax=Pelagicoccus sp. SDUM812003 TaxID=3041267 RepID=UPI00280CE7E9|nr:TonB-dependent receptor [Pelagicoccus sp. SDUM812003]MDQ8202929.1 TonB-dependent receptor [Pelagicoccus sp. SDUM812003]
MNTLKLNKHALTATSAVMLAASAWAQQDLGAAYELDPYTVTTATRVEKQISSIPQSVSIVSEQSLQDQLSISSDLISALSQMAPSYSPSRGKMTGAGETFRGRNPLFMIDGVPQSNPLRDGSRDGYTIDPAMIERIELVHGASAAQGMGATGGIINYVTKRAPAVDGLNQWAEFGLSSSDQFSSDGVGYRSAYGLGYRQGDLGLVGGVTYEWRPMSYDGDGNLVGIDNVQGDTMNSSALDLYGKLTYQLDEDQELRFMVNTFEMKQDLEYVQVAGDREAGVPTTSIEGETIGKATQNDVTTLSASYRHNAIGGGKLSVDLFANDFAATYGGGTYGTFIYEGELIFDQSENQSEKKGAKVTFVRDLDEYLNLGLVTGIDFFEDTTQQVLVQTNRQWVPETTYESWAPYLQLDRLVGDFVVTTGVRFENAKLDVGDFTTLESYGSQEVAGGSPDFDEWLFNLGTTYRATDALTVFASYTQGFGMADVGRVLRGINEPGQDVDDFLDLEPVVTDNYELGARWSSENWKASLSGYWSTSDLGSRLQANEDGIYLVRREKTEIWGAEAELERDLDARSSIGGVFAWVDGKSDTDGDGEVDTRLNGANIPPARLNLYWNRVWGEGLRTRFQASNYFDSDSRGFSGYTLFDLLLSYELGEGALKVGLENVFDKQYITYYSQTVGNDSRYFAGRGRTLTAKYSFEF